MHPRHIIAALIVIMVLLELFVISELSLRLLHLIMSAPVVISSGEQFNNILSTTTYVVADCKFCFTPNPSSPLTPPDTNLEEAGISH